MNERQRALDLAVSQIEKQFGKGSIMKLGEASARLQIEVIPTGALAVDIALGVGGVPRGRVVEIYGPESSGKTTLGYHIMAEAQREGGVAAFIDAEHALDPRYAKAVGVDIDSLLISQPDSGEQALEIAEMLVRSGAVDVVTVDSVAALVPRAELEGDMGDAHMGLQARLMSQALRKLVGAISRSNTTVIFINQIREKIGVMFGCFHYNTRVVLADGTTEKIGKIVNQKLPVEVLSYDPATGSIQPRRVVNWFDNGVADHFLQFEVEGGGSGRRRFAVTPNHMIFTPRGEVPAGELRVGDEVLVGVEDYRLTADQLQVLLGSSLGDGSLRKTGREANLPVGQNRAQMTAVLERVELGTELDHVFRRHYRAAAARINRTYVKPRTRSMHRFDLEVEGNHTYLVDGIVVHNSPETTTGGRALKFYSSVRMEIRRTENLKSGDEVKGMRARVKVVKNKVAPPFRDAEVDIYYGHGISKTASTLDVAVAQGIVQRSGTWFAFGEMKLGQGRDNARDFLDNNPELAHEIEQRVRAAVGLLRPAQVAETPAPAVSGKEVAAKAKG